MKKRISESPFPMEEIDVVGYIKYMWQYGWFDSYSNKHFLIRAIRRQISKIEWESQLISNNCTSIHTPINSNGSIQYDKFSEMFIVNLSARLRGMCNCFGEDSIKHFVEDQLSAGKSNYNENLFFQALSEIEILTFYIAQTKWDKAIYEPPIGTNGSNPEAQFEKEIDDFKVSVNIEVKTPEFPNFTGAVPRVVIPSILLSDTGRKEILKLCELNNTRCVMPRVTKLVQFLNSASSKFQKPNKDEYNLLYINWSYSDFPSNGFLEAWSLLTNEINGILVHPEIGTNLPFKEPVHKDVYEKITAVIVYTSSLDQLMFSDFRYCFQTSPKVGPRFRMFVLNKELRKMELTDQSNLLFKVTGMNPSRQEPNKWRLLCNHNWSSKTLEEEIATDFNFDCDALSIINTYPYKSKV